MIDQPTILRVCDIIGGPLAVAADDGQLVCDAVAAHLREGQAVQLSFDSVTTLTGAFLQAAIGQLYGTYPGSRIRCLLAVPDLSPDDQTMIEQAVQNAKAYYANPQAYDEAWKTEGANYG